MISNNSQAYTRRIILEKPYVEISFDEHNDILVAIWKGSLQLEQVKTACGLMTCFVLENEIRLHLTDHTQLKALPQEVQDYLSTTWFGEIEQAGLRKVAIKLAKDIFTQATIRKLNQEITPGNLQTESFSTADEAIKWLLA